MPRRISNILSSSLDHPDRDLLEAAISRVWRTTFPHLPPRFAPAWDYHLDTLHKHRSKLLRVSRNTPNPDIPDEHHPAIRDLTKQIRRTVKQNKRTIIRIIVHAFSIESIDTPDFQFSKCCSAAPLPNPSVHHHTSSDTRLRNLLPVLESDDSQIAKLCAIVDHVPHFYLTRVLGPIFIRRFPHLQFPTEQQPEHTQLDEAVTKFLERCHWHCRCGSMCSQPKHACSVK